ncbi:hypothetical protein Kpol_440p9 [Vanderwaltozyma polyspora DSM 70294]|uniref:Crossover junction endonuclease MUS81 n=1 Tax=Vanderwaltozyma polyspora (strain ATCC 22028 / DSM 70294 / BCRC 21397 / CBS 2163 / NBRC 10782 / NRRL Y-8283 / UCD 57-17) TaxID=436907 RepID=A7TRE8_VANPO|nr:uncharacterized protein Kpol_440p9 [Vanderwaltozyma polyspora DSM 70294]EDO15162.1 hypothetical protein Kpol_440p9 [Vanderwaltozyma polyspora DSM 70294]
MSLPSNLKDLYLDWLQELIDSLGSHQDQLKITYEKAKRNLASTDGVFVYPNDLLKISGIGNAIMRRMEKKLATYCKGIGCNPPTMAASSETEDARTGSKRSMTTLRSNSTLGDGTNEQPVKRKKRKYIPKKRSGGYAILLALLESKAISRGLTKDEIIENGQKFCKTSMAPNYATKEMYGAWSSIAALKSNCLVLEEGRPKRYILTDEGMDLAKTLKSADNIVFPDEYISNQMMNNNNQVDPNEEFSADLSTLYPENKKSTMKRSYSSSLLEITIHQQNSSPVFSRPENTNIFTSSSKGTPNQSTRPLSEGNTNSDQEKIIRRRFKGTSYELWKRDAFEILPIIDHREVKSKADREFFINAFERKGMKADMKQLALGDIIWVARHKISGYQCVLNTIVERKRLDDLADSIKDNRFMEQKNRLEKSGCKHIYYLIEETIGSSIGGMGEALKTSLWLILIYYRFSMIRTSNSDDTVEKLFALHQVIKKQYEGRDLIVLFPGELNSQDDYKKILSFFKEEFERSNTVECCHSFECFQDVMGKGDMKTVRELTINVLMYIKGVSLEKAIAIQNVYPTLNHILMAYKECKNDEEARLLLFKQLGNAPGAKKITKSLSAKIAETFT